MEAGGRASSQRLQAATPDDASLPSISEQLGGLLELCANMAELEGMCEDVLERLQRAQCQLDEMGRAAEQQPRATLAQIGMRFLAFMTQHGKKTAFDRLVSTRTMIGLVHGFHRDIAAVEACITTQEPEAQERQQTWGETLAEAELAVEKQLLHLWESNPGNVLAGLPDATSQADALLLLSSETTRHNLRYSTTSQRLLESVTMRVARMSGAPIPDVPEWFIPEHEVQREIKPFDRGGYGQVYRGTWRGRAVVIKRVSVNSPEDKRTFLREAKIWHRAQHKNIVKFFGACHLSRPCFFVCEEAENGNLVDYLDRTKLCEQAEVWRLLYEAAMALQYLHEKGIVHGDLKCNQILVSGDGTAKLTDFGLSFLSADSRPNVATGAVRWKAPECLRLEQQAPTYMSDLYSFGMCVVEAVTNVIPWGGYLPDAAVMDHVRHRVFVPRPTEFKRDAEWELVLSLCAFEPSRRAKLSSAIDQMKGFAGEPHVSNQVVANESERREPLLTTDGMRMAQPTLLSEAVAKIKGRAPKQAAKPLLAVSDDGCFKDQFYHAQVGSKGIARLINRSYLKTTDGNDVEQFSDADIVTSGYLVKQGSFWKTWRRRFFILRRDRPVLCYYKSASELVKRGEIPIDGNTTVQCAPKDGFPFRFTVENGGRELTLFAEQGGEAVQAWIASIKGCIKQRVRAASCATMNGSVNQCSEDGSFRTQVLAHLSESMLDAKRDSFWHTNGVTDAMRRCSVDSTSSGQADPAPRLSRSSSAGPILYQEATINGSAREYDDNGRSVLLSTRGHSGKPLVATGLSSSARGSIPSLSGLQLRPSVELAVSVGSKAVQDVPRMLVALFKVCRGQRPVEISRTEIRSSLTHRSCGGDFYARDFNALLSVARTERSMVQFEIFSVENPASEELQAQRSIGFARISALDLLFSRKSTLVLECHRMDPSTPLYYLVIDRAVVPSQSLNVSHTYTYAKRHFVVDTAVVTKHRPSPATNPTVGLLMGGQMSSRRPGHVLLSEELSASYISVSVAVGVLQHLQHRNTARIDEIKRAIRAEPFTNTRKQEEMVHYTHLHASYKESLGQYETMLAWLTAGREQGLAGCLKRSDVKTDKANAFMATNLNCHLVRGKRQRLGGDDKEASCVHRATVSSKDSPLPGEFVYSIVTHGCPAAHSMGFKDGGLRRLKQHLAFQSRPDPRLRERVEMREDIVRSQVLAIAGASFLDAVGLAAACGGLHWQRLQLSCSTGFLLSIEALLNTVGAEKGMLEDMCEGVRWLSNVVSFQLLQSSELRPRMQIAKCVGVSSAPSGDHVLVSFAVPPEVFSTLPTELQQGHAVKLHAVMFNQGINEMQALASPSSLQDELNFENLQTLQRFFRVFQTQVTAGLSNERKREALVELAELQTEIEALGDLLNARAEYAKRKAVNFLLASSDICRRLGAGRTTCCDDGQDRAAMSATLEMTRVLVNYFHVEQGVHLCNAMRERGVRRVNALANSGVDKFALSLKSTPECYKPPLVCQISRGFL